MKFAKIHVKPGISKTNNVDISQATSGSASGTKTQLHSIMSSKSSGSPSLPDIENTAVTGSLSGREATATRAKQ